MIYWRMGVCVSGLLLLAAASPSECRAREITVTVQAPASNYGLEIERVWEVDGEIWVVSRVVMIGDFGAAVITTLEASVEVDAAANSVVKHFISPLARHSAGPVRIESREALETEMEEDGIEIDKVLYDSSAPDN